MLHHSKHLPVGGLCAGRNIHVHTTKNVFRKKTVPALGVATTCDRLPPPTASERRNPPAPPPPSPSPLSFPPFRLPRTQSGFQDRLVKVFKADSIIIHLGTSEVFKASSLRPMPPKPSTAANVNQSFSCAGGSAEALAADSAQVPFCFKD